MNRLTWYETQAQPKVLNAKHGNRLFEVSQVEDDFHAAEVTNGYSLIGVKSKLRNAKRAVELHIGKDINALVEVER